MCSGVRMAQNARDGSVAIAKADGQSVHPTILECAKQRLVAEETIAARGSIVHNLGEYVHVQILDAGAHLAALMLLAQLP
jgi:hypothetical protein